MASDTLTAKVDFLVREARLDADAFRENTIYNGDGDAIRLIANAERLEQYAETMEAQATRIEALEAALRDAVSLCWNCGGDPTYLERDDVTGADLWTTCPVCAEPRAILVKGSGND